MKVIYQIINVFFLCFFICCSVHNEKVTKKEYENLSNQNKCNLFQNRVDLNSNNFTPYDSIYNHFHKSIYDVDVLHRRIGQKPHIARYIFDSKQNLNNLYINLGNNFMEKKIRHVNLDFESQFLGEYAYLCNVGSSDQNTNIYIIKIKGEIISKLWFENGNYLDLTDLEKQKLNNILNLLDIISTAGTTDNLMRQ